MHAFQAGRQESFQTLYAAFWPAAFLRASRMGLPPQEAEEVAQRTLVRVCLYARRASFGRPEQLWAWLYTIASREVYKLWRAKPAHVLSGQAWESWSANAADASPAPPAAAASAEAVEHVEECIARLPEAERAALLAVLVGGLTFRQAAAAHGLRLGQFKHRYEKALAKVRQCMRSKGHDVQ
jgi:RNA polymerase sigma factor (sigma-70 family)